MDLDGLQMLDVGDGIRQDPDLDVDATSGGIGAFAGDYIPAPHLAHVHSGKIGGDPASCNRLFDALSVRLQPSQARLPSPRKHDYLFTCGEPAGRK